jgi:hypothetical protein
MGSPERAESMIIHGLRPVGSHDNTIDITVFGQALFIFHSASKKRFSPLITHISSPNKTPFNIIRFHLFKAMVKKRENERSSRG